MIVRRFVGLMALVLVLAACGTGEVSDDETSSIPDITPATTPPATTIADVLTTTSVSSEANLVTAESLVAAMYAADEKAHRRPSLGKPTCQGRSRISRSVQSSPKC